MLSSCLGACFGKVPKSPQKLVEPKEDEATAPPLADVSNQQSTPSRKSQAVPQRRTALHLAAESGHVGVLQTLFETLLCSALAAASDPENGADLQADTQTSMEFLKGVINARDSRQQTPLLIAAARGHSDCVKFLLSNGADRSRGDAKGNTPLHVASARGYLSIILMLCSEFGDEAELQRCLDAPNDAGFTPLHHAVWGRQSAAVQILLQQGADMMAKNTRAAGDVVTCPPGTTPLHLAACRGHVEISRILLKSWMDRVVEPMMASSGSAASNTEVAAALAALDPRAKTNAAGHMPYQLSQRLGFFSLALLLRPNIPITRLFSAEERNVRFYGPPQLKAIAAAALNKHLVAQLDVIIEGPASASQEQKQQEQPHPVGTAAASPQLTSTSSRAAAAPPTSLNVRRASADMTASGSSGGGVLSPSAVHAETVARSGPSGPAGDLPPSPGRPRRGSTSSMSPRLMTPNGTTSARVPSTHSLLMSLGPSTPRAQQQQQQQAHPPGRNALSPRGPALRHSNSRAAYRRDVTGATARLDAGTGSGGEEDDIGRGDDNDTASVLEEFEQPRLLTEVMSLPGGIGRETARFVPGAAIEEYDGEEGPSGAPAATTMMTVGGLGAGGGTTTLSLTPSLRRQDSGTSSVLSFATSAANTTFTTEGTTVLMSGVVAHLAADPAGAALLLTPSRRRAPSAAGTSRVAAAVSVSGAAATAAGCAACAPLQEEGEEEEEECGVCLEHTADVLISPCSHVICGPCARKMCSIAPNKASSCPFCRSLIAKFALRAVAGPGPRAHYPQ